MSFEGVPIGFSVLLRECVEPSLLAWDPLRTLILRQDGWDFWQSANSAKDISVCS